MGYSFAGHETFICRNYWLKKGLDYAWSGGTFNNLAIKELGVGKNMVGAIRFWSKAFGLIEFSEQYSKLAKYIFETQNGRDPYLEDIGTIWLLHYLLVTSEVASIYSLVFNYFRKTRLEFTRDQIVNFLEAECQKKQQHYSVNSLKKDVAVFLNNYLLPKKSKSIEKDFMGLLYELDLIDRVRMEGHNQTYRIDNKERKSLPPKILLVCIMLKLESTSITFNELLTGINSVGSVFAINSKYLMDCIDQICNDYPDQLVYKDDAGVQVFQIREGFDLFTVLNDYYGK
jgi:hypothetical protein